MVAKADYSQKIVKPIFWNNICLMPNFNFAKVLKKLRFNAGVSAAPGEQRKDSFANARVIVYGTDSQISLAFCKNGLDMIVVVTGMVGVDKKNYLERVCELAVERGQETLLKAQFPSSQRFQGHYRQGAEHAQRDSQHARDFSLASRPVSGGGFRPDAAARRRHVHLYDRRRCRASLAPYR